ncbi:MAG: BLUF domain-containing protein [Methylacidiphilales bacterium]|nr:BLUF domain-containing protein [Candidatus Methylacidiphilales bacterium]
MIQITYISRATEPLSAENLLTLLQQCLPNNASHGVTGMLLYGNETFLQVLEGDEKAVNDLFDIIRKDPRHTDIQVLRRGPIDRRQYSEWSMGFKRISDQALHNIEGLRNFGERDFNFDYLVQHDNIVEVLMDHYRQPYWDPLVRELDAKDKVVEHLKKTLASTRSSVEIASLILESVIDASRNGSLSEGHIRLCESALNALRQQA